jgi:DNA-directed RNA polymerase subunit RPC12/RpoP
MKPLKLDLIQKSLIMLLQLENLKCPYCGSKQVSEDRHDQMWCNINYLIPRIYWKWICDDCNKRFNLIVHITDYEVETIGR